MIIIDLGNLPPLSLDRDGLGEVKVSQWNLINHKMFWEDEYQSTFAVEQEWRPTWIFEAVSPTTQRAVVITHLCVINDPISMMMVIVTNHIEITRVTQSQAPYYGHWSYVVINNVCPKKHWKCNDDLEITYQQQEPHCTKHLGCSTASVSQDQPLQSWWSWWWCCWSWWWYHDRPALSIYLQYTCQGYIPDVLILELFSFPHSHLYLW